VYVGTIPTLLDLGYTHPQVEALRDHARQHPNDHLAGGEDAALLLLDKMMQRTTWVAQFEKPKTSPNALTFDTTGLSPCTFRCRRSCLLLATAHVLFVRVSPHPY
jgi:hypothetical protein